MSYYYILNYEYNFILFKYFYSSYMCRTCSYFMAENAGMENSDTDLNIPLFVLFAFSLWSLQY